MPLLLAAQIVGSKDRPHDISELLAPTPAIVSELAELTEQELQAHMRGSDEPTYVYLLQASLALAGTETWGTELEGINNDEFEVQCPACTVGSAHCADCDALFRVDEAIAARWTA
jgi:hypothetical protein